MLLTVMGHDTRIAHDGLEGVELAEAFRPDLIVLDIGLPKLNGWTPAAAFGNSPGRRTSSSPLRPGGGRTRTAAARKRRASITTWSSPWTPPPWGSWRRTGVGRSGYTRVETAADGPLAGNVEKGEAMTEDYRSTLSPQEMEGRFDLLATEAKEYAVFLVGPGGQSDLLEPRCGAPVRLPVGRDHRAALLPLLFARRHSQRPARTRTQDGLRRRAGRTAFAGRCGRTAHGFGVSPS